MRSATVTCVLCLGLWALSSANAEACSCGGSGTACTAVSRADAVFVGRVTSVASGVQFEVERAVLGVAPGQVTLGNGPGNCALSFTVGERYVVYAYRDRASGMLYTGMCTRTRLLGDAHSRADLAYFDRLQQSSPKGTLLTGVVSNVTVDLSATAPSARPLGGILVSASPIDGGPPRTTLTRADGSYEFTSIASGRLSISAKLPVEFEPLQPVTLAVAESTACAEAFFMARLDGRIRGQLLDERGLPARGVDVQVADAGSARDPSRVFLSTLNAVTDENGWFEFRYVGPGQYVVGVELRNPLRPGKLSRRRFYGQTSDPAEAELVVLGNAERRQLPPFRLVPLPAERVITIVVIAPTPEVADNTRLFLRGATREPVESAGRPLKLTLPFGAAFALEASPPQGYQVRQNYVRIDRDDADRTIEIRVESR